MSEFTKGIKDAVPISIGYFAVAFSLGISAKNAGIPAPLGFLGSFFIRASAGEYGVYSLMAVNAAYFEVVAICIIANLRYLLMSTALTQKFSPQMPVWKRVLCSCCITDEIFGLSIAHKTPLPLSYPIGATVIAGTFWGAGTAMGITAGAILPANLLSALSVALYGMFIAIIIPPCRKSRTIGVVVAAAFLSSLLLRILVPSLGSGMRTVIVSIIISALAAAFKPVKEDEQP